MIPSNRLTTHDSRLIDFPEVLAFHSLLSPFVVVWPRASRKTELAAPAVLAGRQKVREVLAVLAALPWAAASAR